VTNRFVIGLFFAAALALAVAGWVVDAARWLASAPLRPFRRREAEDELPESRLA
jgi:hypothetical protein